MNILFLDECFESHLEKMMGLDSTVASKYCHHVKTFIKWYLDPTQEPNLATIQSITRADIESYLEECCRLGNDLKALEEKHSALRDYFRFLVHIELLKSDSDPMADIPSPSADWVLKIRTTHKAMIDDAP